MSKTNIFFFYSISYSHEKYQSLIQQLQSLVLTSNIFRDVYWCIVFYCLGDIIKRLLCFYSQNNKDRLFTDQIIQKLTTGFEAV